MSEASIEILDPRSAEARAIIAASDAFYIDLYPAESNHLESVTDLERPNVIFVGCRLDGELVGTGGAKKNFKDVKSYRRRKRWLN